REPLVALDTRRDRGKDGAEGESAEQRRARREHGEGRDERAADRRDHREDRHGDDHPHAAPGEDPGYELADADRRRDGSVVRPQPLEARPDRKRRDARRGLHGGRREQRGRHELQVAETPEVGVRLVNQAPQEDADRDEEEDGVEERGGDRPAPQRAEGVRLPADDRDRAPDGVHQSIRLRPVSRRKTSSSVERRTRTVSGASPRACTSSTTASPSSVPITTRSCSTSTWSASPSNDGPPFRSPKRSSTTSRST